jgi:glycerol-3-phosphate dehydrogenase
LTLPALDREPGPPYDALVIGGGVNGTAALVELARAGYRVALAERDDLADGASGRSSRMLHCGLRYFETPDPVRDFALHPARFLRALGMAREAMRARAELAGDPAVATRAVTLCFPLWQGGGLPRWQVRAGLAMLAAMNPGGPPLEPCMLGAGAARQHPVGSRLRELERLTGMASFREYLFAHPERICVNAALEAEELGASLFLGTVARIAGRGEDGLWRVALDGQGEVRARTVLNMAGSWIDEVGRFPRRLVRGTKGAHIVIRLPEGWKGVGVATLHRGGHPFYGLPLGEDRFYFGPTETPFDGDARDVQCTAEDMDFLLAEANHLFPALKLGRSDVVQTWAGVRPLTFDPNRPMGARERVLHELGPNLLALTAGPVMTHRSAGRLAARAVERRIGPAPRPPISRKPIPNCADPVVRAVLQEHARDIGGVVIQRTGAIWAGLRPRGEIEELATRMAPHLDWDEDQKAGAVDDFLALQERRFGVPPEQNHPSSNQTSTGV